MSILSTLGLGRKVRYGIVAVGDIAQEAMLPGVTHTAIPRSPPLSPAIPRRRAAWASSMASANATATTSSKRCCIRARSTRSTWRRRTGATPNSPIPALKAGIHVLVEKPLEVSTAKCRDILEAQKASPAKLMVAYRLHFEPATLDALDKVTLGRIGGTAAVQFHLRADGVAGEPPRI